MRLFRAWFDDARGRPSVAEANAMTLATADADGRPSARMVLLKGIDAPAAAFRWYTNLESRKAHELAAHAQPYAALVWWWPGVPGRQVRAVGPVQLIARDEVDAYFASRPGSARIGAAASQQSEPIASRHLLETRAEAIAARAETDASELERAPASWGGMQLRAEEIEFWQGRRGRLHDRIAFMRADARPAPPHATLVVDDAGTSWHRVRLQP